MFTLVLALAIGIGFLASLFGIGGGFLLLPTMTILIGLTTHETVATIPLVIIFMSLSSTLAYAHQKRIDFKVVSIVVIASILGSIAGAYTAGFVSGKMIKILFGCVEGLLAIMLGVKNQKKNSAFSGKSEITSDYVGGSPIAKYNDELVHDVMKRWYVLERCHLDRTGTVYNYSANILVAFPLSFVAGFLSSLLGIGGGTLYIQIFVFVCGMSIHMAIASSMACIFISAIASFFSFVAIDVLNGIAQINYIVALAYGIGMIIGAQIGARVGKMIKSQKLKPLAALMILIIAIYMVISTILVPSGD